jgi:multidrug resistance efflux pump
MKYLNEELEKILDRQPDYHKVVNDIYLIKTKTNVKYWFLGIGILLAILLFLPWTQNIRGKGKVTTLYQDQRPQELNSVLPGRIAKWYVKEGDLVQMGDTILELSEVKEEYLDPQLLQRTSEQINAKKQKAGNYKNKAQASQSQIGALGRTVILKRQELNNKIRQQELKVKSERANLSAAQTKAAIAQKQYDRNQELYKQGLISLTDLEAKQNSLQATQAKETEINNKYINIQQDLNRMRIELQRIQQEYSEKIAKTQSERYESLSAISNTESEIAKLQNLYGTYDQRRKLYIVRAPQNGQITDARVSGIGEVIKQGEHLVTIVPEKIKYTVELFVKPLDVPLIKEGQQVAFLFDGFPAIVFSGWPNASYGTFRGKVLTIENNLNDNGFYRVLVVEDDTEEKPWPVELRIGAGAQGIALLNDVPIWYELWRNVNGFPPNYYQAKTKEKKEK